MRKWLLTFYDQKNSGAYTQYLLCGFHFSISSVCKYWAPFLGNGILPTYIFRSCNKMSDVYDQYLLCRLRFSICSPGIYWAPSREVQEGAPYLGNGILAPYIFRSYDKKFQKSTINICFVWAKSVHVKWYFNSCLQRVILETLRTVPDSWRSGASDVKMDLKYVCPYL